MKKVLFLLLITFEVFSCKSKQVKTTSNPITINTATYQKWYGGREGSRGIKIEIIGKENLKDCEYKNIYFYNKQAPIYIKNLENDTIELTANINTGYNRHDRILSSDRNKELKNKAPIKPKYPNLGKDEAMIEYLQKGELNSFKITLKQKKDLLYQ